MKFEGIFQVQQLLQGRLWVVRQSMQVKTAIQQFNVVSLIVCANKYQESTDIWSVSNWLCAYINVFFGKFETQSDHISVNYSIAPGLY